MIPADLPPGTPLVVVWLPATVAELAALVRADLRFLIEEGEADLLPEGLRVGQRVTLERYAPNPGIEGGVSVYVREAVDAHVRRCFDVLPLPEELTGLLANTPAMA